ncbi:MFS transporter [Pseudonocardia petroleophila]|uniref:MFS transporter n=1 Tax=Pseudonocardia petroleophila TaxID=37331 RepID=UPI002106A742|nr:MFS transporter [Pseudonocardia petroleophila]
MARSGFPFLRRRTASRAPRPAGTPRPTAQFPAPHPTAPPATAAFPAAPHPTTPPEATPHQTAPHQTAPHQTAPHQTAPHQTAPHQTAPHPAVEHPTTPVDDRYAPRRRYPWHDDPGYDPAAHRRTPPPAPPWTPTTVTPPVPPQSWTPGPPDARDEVLWTEAGPPPVAEPEPAAAAPAAPKMPRKLTVTRVAAMRSRQITGNGIRAFQRAASADGADRSGLTALTYATMMTYAVDAAVAVALANTLFFAAATAESVTNVALYLAITVAPFAVVAPVIGPLLDRLQRGRRAALAVSFGGRAVLAVVMALNYDNWGLYPAALGVMVLSKTYHVLKSAVTPRVLPSRITLATTNSRLTTFGLVAGGVFGGTAAGIAALAGSPGALFFTAALAVAGTLLCLRIPRWVESTAGEVPAALRSTHRGRRRPVSRGVVVALWGNGSMRFLTGFLTLFVAFTVRAQAGEDPARQLFLIGIVGAAAGLGSFGGNAAGSRQRFSKIDTVIVGCIAVAVAAAVVAAVLPGIATAAIVALVASTCSALAKVCLDAVIQRDLPEESRASAFGRSETVLQLAWVFGGALGVLLPHDTYGLGFVVASAMVAIGGVQTALIARGHSILPFLAPRSEPARTRT